MTSATLGWSSPSLPMARTPGDGERGGWAYASRPKLNRFQLITSRHSKQIRNELGRGPREGRWRALLLGRGSTLLCSAFGAAGAPAEFADAADVHGVEREVEHARLATRAWRIGSSTSTRTASGRTRCNTPVLILVLISCLIY